MVNGEQLPPAHETILQHVADHSDPTTPTLKTIDTIADLYDHPNSINRALSHLEDADYLTSTGGNPKQWAVTEKGTRELTRIEQAQQADPELYGEAEAHEVFRDYFEHVAENELLNAKIGKGHIYIDHDDLERFDAELADELLTEPENMIDACETALNDYLGIEDEVEVRIKNVPDIYHKPISELSDHDLNQLVTVKGVLQSVSAPKLQLTWAQFECTSCSNVYGRKQHGSLKSPYKCGKCDNKKFRATDKEYTTVRYLHLKEQPGQQKRDKIVVIVKGDLAVDEQRNLRATGSGLSVTGYLEPYKPKKTADAYDMRLVANNVEVSEDKWDDIEVTDTDVEQIQAIAENDHTRHRVVRSVAADTLKNEALLKEAILVWLLGRTQDGNIHLLVFGDPGTGKSAIARYLHEHYPRIVKSVATGATGVGLTASVTKDSLTGEWVAEAGSLAMADDGYHITDEIDKLSDADDISNMNEALSDGTISLDKANIHTEIAADVSELAIGNPSASVVDPYQDRWKQIPIDDSKSDLKDRFDLYLCLSRNNLADDAQKDKEREVVRHMIRRGHFEMGAGDDAATDTDNPENTAAFDLIERDLLLKYIAYAQRLSPELTEEAANNLEEVYFELNSEIDSKDRTDSEPAKRALWGRRRLMSLKKVAIAYARLDLSEEVAEEHVEQAKQFVGRCFATIDFDIGSNSTDDLSTSVSQDKAAVLEAVELIDQANEDDGATVDEIVEETELTENRVEELVELLSREGEIFSPVSGTWKPT
jgi:replicative DNA helicase Mcm